MITILFWKIIGFGFAIPCTLVCIITLLMSATKENYIVSMKKLSICYSIAILAWSIALGIK